VKFLRRAVLTFAALLVLAGATVAGLGCYAFAAPRYHGPKSDHFDGERFFTPGAPDHGSFAAFWKWQTDRHPGPWRQVADA